MVGWKTNMRMELSAPLTDVCTSTWDSLISILLALFLLCVEEVDVQEGLRVVVQDQSLNH